MKRTLLLTPALLIALLICFCPAGFAQSVMTTTQLSQLENQVKVQQFTYQKFEMSEREALEEGLTENAARYREAKNKAYEAYVKLQDQYQKALAERRAYDKKAQTSTDVR